MRDEGRTKHQLIDELKHVRQRIIELEQLETSCKRTEEEIRRLTSAVEQSIDGVAMGDLERNLVYVNEAFARMHGYTPEEMIGMNVVNLHSEEQMDDLKRGMDQMSTHGSWAGEIGHIRKDGTLFPTYTSVTLLKDDDGRPTGILAVARDITERKQAEEKLLAYQRQLRSMASELSLTQERERRRIATELHDSIGLADRDTLMASMCDWMQEHFRK